MPRPTRTPAPRPTAATAPAIVHEVLALAGAALPADVQASARRRLDFDPGRIRIHTDGHAAASAAAVGARAYTVGRHIAFAADAFAPHTPAGRALLDHELRHAAEQQDAPVPGRGALAIDHEPGHEHPAELAEHGAWTAPRPVHRAVLQRKLEARAIEALPAVQTRVRAALDRLDLRAALRILRELPPGAGPELARLDPNIRRLVGAHLSEPQDRFTGLVLLSGADFDAPHVRLGQALASSRAAGLAAFPRLAATTPPREIEAAFDRDLPDLVPGSRTLARAFGVGPGGLFITLERGLVSRVAAPALHAVMLLDHVLSDAEVGGVRLAAGSPAALLAAIRSASRDGDDAEGLDALVTRWSHDVQFRRRWVRADLVTREWCTLSLEQAVDDFLDEGPRLQVRGFFESLRQRQRERTADFTFAELVEEHGLAGAYERVARKIEGRLRSPDEAATAKILETLRYLKVADIRAIDLAFRGRNRRSLATAVRDLPRTSAEFFGLLALVTLGTFQREPVRFASAVFRGQILEALNTLYFVSDSARPAFHTDYRDAFVGLRDGDGEYTDYRHVLAQFTTRWKYEKACALLDARITDAEELYFAAVAVSSPSNADVVKILDATRSTGTRAPFHKLNADWNRFVRTPRGWNKDQPLTALTMREALRMALSGAPAARAENLFQTFGEGLRPGETSRVVSDLEPALRLFERALLDDDAAQTKKELGYLGALIAELRKSDTAGQYTDYINDIERRIRVYLAYRERSQKLDADEHRSLLARHLGGGKLRDADEIYRQFQLAAGSSNEIAAFEILKIVTQNWLAGTLATLVLEANTPLLDARTSQALRPKYRLSDLQADSGIVSARFNDRLTDIFSRVQHAATPNGDLAAHAADRLMRELEADSFITPERLKGAFEFIALIPPHQVPGVIQTFAQTYLADRPGNPAERFVNYLLDDFGLSKDVPAIAEKIRARPTTPSEVLTRARFVEASRHTGWASDVGGYLAAKFGNRNVGPAIHQALRNLEALTRDERLQPEVLAGNLARSGKANALEAAEREYNEIKANVEIENQLKKDLADWTSFAIEIGVRAALAAVFGPAGITGLVIALTTISGSKLVAKGFLGANYELLSPENIASLVTELTGTGYELLKVEERIGEFVKKFSDSPFIRNLLAGSLNKLATGTVDGIIERAIQQNALPDATKVVGFVLGALADGLGKALAGKLTFNVTSFTRFSRRWVLSVARDYLAGPPPKGSTLSSGLGTLVKIFQDLYRNGRDEFDLEYIKKKVGEWAIQNLTTGLAVGSALAVAKNREARPRVRAVEQHPEAFALLAAEIEPLRKVIQSLPPREQAQALVKLLKDPSFGRDKLGFSSDPADPNNRFAHENLRRLADEVTKNFPTDGIITPEARAKVVNQKAQDEFAARVKRDADAAAAAEQKRLARVERDARRDARANARAEEGGRRLGRDTERRLARQEADAITARTAPLRRTAAATARVEPAIAARRAATAKARADEAAATAAKNAELRARIERQEAASAAARARATRERRENNNNTVARALTDALREEPNARRISEPGPRNAHVRRRNEP